MDVNIHNISFISTEKANMDRNKRSFAWNYFARKDDSKVVCLAIVFAFLAFVRIIIKKDVHYNSTLINASTFRDTSLSLT